MMLISPMTSSVHFEPLIEVASAKLPHCEASVFPFLISEYLKGTFSETLQILSCSSPDLRSLVLAWLWQFVKAPQGILTCRIGNL